MRFYGRYSDIKKQQEVKNLLKYSKKVISG